VLAARVALILETYGPGYVMVGERILHVSEDWGSDEDYHCEYPHLANTAAMHRPLDLAATAPPSTAAPSTYAPPPNAVPSPITVASTAAPPTAASSAADRYAVDHYAARAVPSAAASDDGEEADESCSWEAHSLASMRRPLDLAATAPPSTVAPSAHATRSCFRALSHLLNAQGQISSYPDGTPVTPEASDDGEEAAESSSWEADAPAAMRRPLDLAVTSPPSTAAPSAAAPGESTPALRRQPLRPKLIRRPRRIVESAALVAQKDQLEHRWNRAPRCFRNIPRPERLGPSE
jgi:hypothetical protein